MTQHEFESRTMVKVTAYEFEAINAVYLASDLDKDEFCKIWCKMNANRVKAAKAEEKRQNLICNVLDIYAKKNLFNGTDLWKLGVEVLNEKEISTLKEFGVEMEGLSSWGVRYFKTCSDLFWEIDNKIKTAIA